MSSYRARPTASSKSSSIDFSRARAIFDTAKQPQVQNAFLSAVKNPTVRSIAASSAKNEKVQSAVIKTAQDDRARSTILDLAKLYESQSTKNTSNFSGYRQSNKNLIDTNTSTASSCFKSTPPQPQKSANSDYYPSLFDQQSSSTDPFSSPIPSKSLPNPFLSFSSTTGNNNDTNSYNVHSNTNNDKFTSIQNNLASLDLFNHPVKPAVPLKKIPPARPPPPKANKWSGSNRLSTTPTNEPHAIVKYPYKASQFDELSCQPNDVVILKKEVDDQWIYALNTRTGEHGILPIVFLDIKIPLVPTQKANLITQQISSLQRRETTTATARALYDYDSAVEGDLKYELFATKLKLPFQFRANDIIKVQAKVNNEWLRGEIDSKCGIFPANFVQLLSPITSSSKPPTSSSVTNKIVTATFDYNSGVPDDLVFRKGDRIEVVERINDDWIKGQLNGRIGLVPMTYVESGNSHCSVIPTSLTSLQTNRTVRANQDYYNQSPAHLCFSKGDQIEIMQQIDKEWLKGKLILNMSNQKSFPCGIFPRSAVE
ncbi:unnamed protein product [Anisakis simplex]|uniref:LD44138p (inferred by orthology to a D. melanogaster protein) n=1 Tax=Anisakis simplex TaxID=6269 RepID=A0A0M3IXY4_ANISI|nr:unnamed protein product [Anisakis simplex]